MIHKCITTHLCSAASEQKLKGAVAHWLHRDPTAGQWWEESRAFVL